MEILLQILLFRKDAHADDCFQRSESRWLQIGSVWNKFRLGSCVTDFTTAGQIACHLHGLGQEGNEYFTLNTYGFYLINYIAPHTGSRNCQTISWRHAERGNANAIGNI